MFSKVLQERVSFCNMFAAEWTGELYQTGKKEMRKGGDLYTVPDHKVILFQVKDKFENLRTSVCRHRNPEVHGRAGAECPLNSISALFQGRQRRAVFCNTSLIPLSSAIGKAKPPVSPGIFAKPLFAFSSFPVCPPCNSYGVLPDKFAGNGVWEKQPGLKVN